MLPLITCLVHGVPHSIRSTTKTHTHYTYINTYINTWHTHIHTTHINTPNNKHTCIQNIQTHTTHTHIPHTHCTNTLRHTCIQHTQYTDTWSTIQMYWNSSGEMLFFFSFGVRTQTQGSTIWSCAGQFCLLWPARQCCYEQPGGKLSRTLQLGQASPVTFCSQATPASCEIQTLHFSATRESASGQHLLLSRWAWHMALLRDI